MFLYISVWYKKCDGTTYENVLKYNFESIIKSKRLVESITNAFFFEDKTLTSRNLDLNLQVGRRNY